VSALVLAAFLVPLAAVPLIWLARDHPNPREGVTLVAAVALFALVVALYPGISAGGRPGVTLVAMLPAVPLRFEVEPLGLLFALVASFLWIVTSVYSIGYMRCHHEVHQTRFYAYFALALAAAIGVAFAANLVTLFVFYEALTLSTYPLVTHHGTPEARAGGRTYLVILLATSTVFFLLAILATAAIAGTTDFRAGGILAGKASPVALGVLLALFVFGIGKAAVMPFHRWLPAAMVAPTPVSALLHAVAVVKAGVFSVLKVVLYVFGADVVAGLATGRLLAYVAAATIVIASLVALGKDNLKARLAYSTVSQLSYIVLGALIANAAGIVGGAMHIAMHAFGKITLFFCAGAIYVATGRTEVSQLSGIGRAMPITMAAFLLASLSIIGLPPFGGLWGKWYLILGALGNDAYVFVAALVASSLLNVFYLLPIPLRAFFGRPDGRVGEAMAEAPWACVAALSVTAIGTLVLFFAADPLYALLLPLVAPR